jgi:hypothetical protein
LKDPGSCRKDYPLFGSWKGLSEVEKFFKGVAQHEEATDFSPREFFDAGDRVCVLGHYAWKNPQDRPHRGQRLGARFHDPQSQGEQVPGFQ